MSHTIHGATLQSAVDVPVDYYSQERKLQHTDVDLLCVHNHFVRWILIDEVFIIPNDLFGTFAQHFADAAIESYYNFRADDSKQVLGCYNLMMSGDTLQFPPIPSSAALFCRHMLQLAVPAPGRCSTCFGANGPTPSMTLLS